jgi:hypothetical protein
MSPESISKPNEKLLDAVPALPLEKSGSTASHRQTAMGRLGLFGLGLGALGVVYGDIGTSPLYAIRECFSAGAWR